MHWVHDGRRRSGAVSVVVVVCTHRGTGYSRTLVREKRLSWSSSFEPILCCSFYAVLLCGCTGLVSKKNMNCREKKTSRKDVTLLIHHTTFFLLSCFAKELEA
jgi:hypothetical protein